MLSVFWQQALFFCLQYRDMSIHQKLKQSKFSNVYEKTFVNLLYTGSKVESLMKDSLAEYKITPVQYNILRILKGSDPNPVSPGTIKSVSVFKKSDLTRIIDRMVQKDLVGRKICQNNRRQVDLNITSVGKSLLKELNPVMNKMVKLNCGSLLSEKEAEQLSFLLDKLHQ